MRPVCTHTLLQMPLFQEGMFTQHDVQQMKPHVCLILKLPVIRPFAQCRALLDNDSLAICCPLRWLIWALCRTGNGQPSGATAASCRPGAWQIRCQIRRQQQT